MKTITITIGDALSKRLEAHVKNIKKSVETPEGTLLKPVTVEQFLRDQFLGSINQFTGDLSSDQIRDLEAKAQAAQAALKQARESELQVSVS